MTHSTPTAADLAALRWACLVDPFADLPRLVLADALEEIGGEDGCRADPDLDLSCPMEDDNGMALRCSVCQALLDEGTPDGFLGFNRYEIRRGFLEAIGAPLDVILSNLDVFRLHPIVEVVATDKRPLHYEGLKEWTWWFEEEEESEPEASLPKIIWNRLRPTKNKNRRGYIRGDANYYTKSEALEDLTRAIVSLGREHAGLPQLKWPT